MVQVFGETENTESGVGTGCLLSEKRVKERLYYNHVGVRTCLNGDSHVNTEEKVKAKTEET